MCAKASVAASGFSITGLMDAQAKTQGRYRVVEIDVSAIQDHPSNSVYSMDTVEIERLARSIERDGLTDLPLVRKLSDGQWQMLSGHRRKAAFVSLSVTDERFSKMPCRVVDSITDAQALSLLHAANLFTRQLTPTERAAASRALGVEVERMREMNPDLKGRRTEDIKAAIISEQTGRKVSGKTVKRQEAIADKITLLAPCWQKVVDRALVSAASMELLGSMSISEQEAILDEARTLPTSKREVTTLIEAKLRGTESKPDKRLVSAERAISTYASSHRKAGNERERELIASMRLRLEELEGGE